MEDAYSAKQLKTAILMILISGTLLSLISYFYLDRAIVDFASAHDFERWLILKWMTYPVVGIAVLAPLFIFYYFVKSLFGSINKHEQQFFMLAVCIAVLASLKDVLKWVFGRPWPATWIDHNRSFLNDHVYGFYPFHGQNYASFPSGHAVITFVTMTILWFFYPRLRWLYILICLIVSVGLITMYYHFLSDVIAGATLGMIGGIYFFYTKLIKIGE